MKVKSKEYFNLSNIDYYQLSKNSTNFWNFSDNPVIVSTFINHSNENLVKKK